MPPLADIATALPYALAITMTLALLCSAVGHVMQATNHANVADELETTKEALDAASHVIAKVSSGIPLPQALAELPQDPEAIDAFKRTLAYFKKTTVPLLFLALVFSGCSAATEAQMHEALLKAEAAVDWVQANPATVQAVLADARKLDPSNAALQKAEAALSNGDVVLAHQLLVGGIILTTPVAVTK